MAVWLVNVLAVCDTEQYWNQLGNLGVGDFRLTAVRRGALLTSALLLSLAVPAEAQIFWPSERGDVVRVERKRTRYAHQRAPKVAEVAKETSKPVGPAILAISIDKQQLKIYDNNGVFAESP